MSFHSLCSSELEFSWVSIFHLCAMVYGEWDFEHLHLDSRTKSAIHCVSLSDFIRFSGHECFHLSNSLVKLWSLRYLVVFSSQASESMCQKSGSQAWFKINEKAGSCGSCSVGVNIRGFLPELSKHSSFEVYVLEVYICFCWLPGPHLRIHSLDLPLCL